MISGLVVILLCAWLAVAYITIALYETEGIDFLLHALVGIQSCNRSRSAILLMYGGI